MFVNRAIYVIHKKNVPCQKPELESKSNDIDDQVIAFLTQMYPKNKSIQLFFNVLLKHRLINEDLFFIDFPHIHIADFCSFLNNRFSKKEQISNDLQRLCKYLHKKKLKFPRISIKNPIAQKMLI
jgi:hypothetical protein